MAIPQTWLRPSRWAKPGNWLKLGCLIGQRVRERAHFGFAAPPYDGMQVYERMRFLHDTILRLARRQSGVALEIGCYRGTSTVFLAKACLRRGIDRIYAVDLFTGTPEWHQSFDTFEEATNRMQRFGLLRHVSLIRSDSQAYGWTLPLDVLHIDADHNYPAVKKDIEKYTPFLVGGGLVVFDDYDASHPGVQQAVHELAADGSFEVVGVNWRGNDWGSICLRRRESDTG